jgi:nucleoside-triphosphatase THEP1
MKAACCGVVVWAGRKHSGKTTAVLGLARAAREAGHSVAGLAAPSVHAGRRLEGFDVVDLATGARAPLARRGLDAACRVGEYGFLEEGLALGRGALTAPAAASADLVIVDEFGPLELRGEGWRPAADRLISQAAGLVLLVVRRELAHEVRKLYPRRRCRELRTPVRQLAEVVIGLLRSRPWERRPAAAAGPTGS